MERIEPPLGDSEERLTQIIAFLPDPTLVVDRSGTVIAWNRAMEDLTGRSAEEMVGRGDHACAVPFYGERRPMLVDVALGHADAEALYDTLQRDGDTVTAEVDLQDVRAGGAVLWCKAGPLRDGRGEVVGAVESIRDVTDQRRAQAALRQSETEKQAILDATREFVILHDPQQRIVWTNAAAAEAAGVAREALVGRRCWEFWGDGVRPCPGCSVAKAFETGEMHEHEQTTPDGREWFVRGTPLFGPDGQITGAVEMARDITDRKRRIKALRDSEARYRLLAENQRDVVVALAPDGRLTYCSPAVKEFGGYNPDEEIGQRITKYIAGDEDTQRVMAVVARTVQDRESATVEFRYQPKDGEPFPAEATGKPVVEDGRVVSVQAVLRDVTARKRAEENLQKFKNALENSTDAIGISTPAGVHYYQNETFTRMFGDIGNDPAGTVYVDRKVGREVFDTITGGKEWSGEVEMYGKDRNVLSILLRAYPIKREGRMIAVVGVHTDITARKRAEAALAEKADELARSNAELQEFAYVASHDLQEPLRMVASYVQLLEKRYADALDEEAGEFIGYAVDGAKRMQTLINDLLQYSRVGTRGKPFAPTDCEAVLEEVLSNLEVAVTEAGARVTHDPLPTVLADEGQLARVFQNLVGNALKFCGQAPRIHVSAEKGDGEWRFSVRDNGIGIDPAQHEKVFAVFHRLHGRGEYPGTGMGLAITKKIVERHGGRIRVESEPGEGATFIFTIPDRKEPSDGNEHGAGIDDRLSVACAAGRDSAG